MWLEGTGRVGLGSQRPAVPMSHPAPPLSSSARPPCRDHGGGIYTSTRATSPATASASPSSVRSFFFLPFGPTWASFFYVCYHAFLFLHSCAAPHCIPIYYIHLETLGTMHLFSFFTLKCSFIQVWVCIVLTEHGRIDYSSGVPVLSLCPVFYHPMPVLLYTTSLSPLTKAADIVVSGMCFSVLCYYFTARGISFYTEWRLVTASCKNLRL